MARLKGSKVIPCQNPAKKRCKGRLVGLPGSKVTCSTCGHTLKLTKKLLKEYGKA